LANFLSFHVKKHFQITQSAASFLCDISVRQSLPGARALIQYANDAKPEQLIHF